ncbi:MAG: M23 family metallopeptidase [Aestuariibacter sp.]
MRRLLILIGMLSVFSTQAIELIGEMTQGSLIRGEVAPGSKVWLNDIEVKVSPEGYFAFGFGRDAKLTHRLSWQTPEQNKESQSLTLTEREYNIQAIEGLPQKMVTPPESVLARIRQDAQQVRQARSLIDNNTAFMEAFIWPAEGPITGVYGSQRVLNGTPKRPHFGVDVGGPVGQPVYAPASGMVTLFVPDMYYSGGTLIIDHGHGISSTFLHLSKGHVKEGQWVNQGELIAEIGATGRATGPHLDWRMNWLKERVDPALLVPERN